MGTVSEIWQGARIPTPIEEANKTNSQLIEYLTIYLERAINGYIKEGMFIFKTSEDDLETSYTGLTNVAEMLGAMEQLKARLVRG